MIIRNVCIAGRGEQPARGRHGHFYTRKEKCRPANAGRHFLVDVQQRLNCALPSKFLWALVSFDSKVFTAYPTDDQLIHPRELAVDLFNRSRINSSAMNLSLERR